MKQNENQEEEHYGTFYTGDPLVLLLEIQDLAKNNGRDDICNLLCDDNKELSQELQAMRNYNLLSEELNANGMRKKIHELTIMITKLDNSSESNKKKVKYEEMIECYKKLLKNRKLRNLKSKYDRILYGSIISRYFTYIGKNRSGEKVEQDGMILNRKGIVLEIVKILGYKILDFERQKIIDNKTVSEDAKKAAIEKMTNEKCKVQNIAYLVNMASTDYSADIIQDIFGKLLSGEEVDLDKIIPPYKEEEIDRKRNKKKILGYAHLGYNGHVMDGFLELSEDDSSR